jgi:hypothetical protein
MTRAFTARPATESAAPVSVEVGLSLTEGPPQHLPFSRIIAAPLIAREPTYHIEPVAAFLVSQISPGLRASRLAIGDGHLGIWSALRDVYPETAEQRCWNHRTCPVWTRC